MMIIMINPVIIIAIFFSLSISGAGIIVIFVLIIIRIAGSQFRHACALGNPTQLIGPFRVHLSLPFKARLSARSLVWKSVFIHIEIESNYQNKNLALWLALKERLTGNSEMAYCFCCRHRYTNKWANHNAKYVQPFLSSLKLVSTSRFVVLS